MVAAADDIKRPMWGRLLTVWFPPQQ